MKSTIRMMLTVACMQGLAGSTAAQVTVAERPSYRVGDTWRYDFTNRRYAKPGCQYDLLVERVTNVGVFARVDYPAGCEVSIVTAYPITPGSTQRFDLDLNPYFYSADAYRLLEFPLSVGKTWSQVWKRNQNGWKYEYEIDAKVEAQERIEVPAGQFETFKIRLRVTYLGEKSGSMTQSGRLEDTLWYAPAAKNFAKRTFIDPGWTNIHRELVSFKIEQQ